MTSFRFDFGDLLGFLAAVLTLPVMLLPTAPDDPPPFTTKNVNARLGVPGDADVIVERPQYVLGFSPERNTADWVCWRLVAADVGHNPRGAFEPDPATPTPRATAATYTRTGFDRGHLCPAKDRSASEDDSIAVFLMSNIVPQAPRCNQRGWERLEDRCRRLAADGKELYIVCGPRGTGGEGSAGRKKAIGTRPKVNVPAELWKVIVALPRVGAPLDGDVEIIAAVFPNDQSVTEDWTRYRTTVADVEERTGLRFFGGVPAGVAARWRLGGR